MIIFPKLLLLWTVFFMLSMWLPALFVPKKFIAVVDKTLKNSDIIRVWAFITMIIWLLFLSVNSQFVGGRPIFFSIFGWLSLLKWLFLLRFPMRGQAKYKFFYAKPVWSLCMWAIILLFSLFMLWVAYYKL